MKFRCFVLFCFPVATESQFGRGAGMLLTSHQCGPGSIPARWHMWIEFVVSSRLAPRAFLRVLRFSSLHKNQQSKFQFG